MTCSSVLIKEGAAFREGGIDVFGCGDGVLLSRRLSTSNSNVSGLLLSLLLLLLLLLLLYAGYKRFLNHEISLLNNINFILMK